MSRTPQHRSDATPRRLALLIGGLLALGVLVRLSWLLRPISALDQLYPDDTYIVLVIARELASTGIPSFSQATTNGFQPLFVLLLAGLGKLTGWAQALSVSGLDRFATLSLTLSAAAHLLAMPFGMAALARGPGGTLAAALFGTLWALHPTMLVHGTNGLETSMASLFLLALWWFNLRWPLHQAKPGALIGHGALLGLAILTRVDLVFLGLYYAHESLRARSTGADATPGAWLRRNALILGPMLAILTPWYLYSKLTTGHLLPISGQAVRNIAIQSYGGDLTDLVGLITTLGTAMFTLALNTPLLLLIAVVLAFSAWRAGTLSQTLKELKLPLITGLGLMVFYVLYVRTWYFFERYMYSTSIAIMLMSVTLIATKLRASPHRAKRVAITATFALLIGSTWWRPGPLDAQSYSWSKLIDLSPDQNIGYRRVGLWAREHLPSGSVVGATQSGAIAYYAPGIKVLNLDGVVHASALAALQQKRIDAYLIEHNAQHLIEWPQSVTGFLDPQSQRSSSALFSAGQPIPGVWAWGSQFSHYKRRP